MKAHIFRCFVIVFISMFLASCVGRQSAPVTAQPSAPVSPSFSQGIEDLAGKLVQKIGAVEKKQGVGGQSTFFIQNKNVENGMERPLDRLIIDKLTNALANHGILLKTSKISTFGRATGNNLYEVQCQEVLQLIGSDFHLLFSCDKSADYSDVMDVSVRILKDKDNTVLGAVSTSFVLKGQAAEYWYRPPVRAPAPAGSLDKPYKGMDTAVNQVVGALACIAKDILSYQDLTELTLGVNVASVGRAIPCSGGDMSCLQDDTAYYAAHYGFNLAPRDKWLSMLVRVGDEMEQSMFVQSLRRQFPNTELVLGVQARPADRAGVWLVEGYLFTLQPLTINGDGVTREIDANTLLPHATWRAYFSAASPGSAPAPSAADYANSHPKKAGLDAYEFNPIEMDPSFSSGATKASRESLTRATQYLREKLRQDGFPELVVQKFSFGGRINFPQCRKEQHYLAPDQVSIRYYCDMDYDVLLQVDGQDGLRFQGRASTLQGCSNINSAMIQCLLKMVEDLYPVVRLISQDMCEAQARQRFENLNSKAQTLVEQMNGLERASAKFAGEFDPSSFMRFIEMQTSAIRRSIDSLQQ